MNEVKKVILFLLCCAIPFSFYAQKARQNAATKKWGYEQTENKGWWENSKYRGNSEADSKVWMKEVILKLVIHNVIILE